MAGKVAPEKRPFTTIQLPNGETWTNPYTPSIDAVKYHASTARRVLAGGSRGGSKTRTAVEDIAATMLKWPGIPIGVGRKDLSDLKRTTMAEFLLRVPEILWDPKYGGQFHRSENWIRFGNGSRVDFVELKDVHSQRSLNMGRWYIDEVHELKDGKDAMRELAAGLRWHTGKGECKRESCVDDARDLAHYKGTTFEDEFKPHHEHPVRQIKMMTNPHGGWLKTEFYTPWRENRLPSGYEYIPFSVFNNPGVDAAYINSLLDNNPKWVRNFVYGEWDNFEHMAFPDFLRSTHVWKGPIPERQFVSVSGGIDWGNETGTDNHRTAMYLTARLRNGKLLTFWESSTKGAPTAELFAKIREMTTRYKVRHWRSDASQFVANSALRNVGIPVQDAPRYRGAVKDGVNTWNRLMKLDQTGAPGWYVTEDCPRLMAGLESYSVDPDTGEYIKRDDDEVDGGRYSIMDHESSQNVIPVTAEMMVRHPANERQSMLADILARNKAARFSRIREILDEEKRWQPSGR